MAKRILALVIWFYTTWMLWTALAAFTGVSLLLGPVVASMVTAFIVGDPMRRIWSPRTN